MISVENNAVGPVRNNAESKIKDYSLWGRRRRW